ncbi:LysR family transcriptional regulator [Marinobacterium jannaschii]|uniref:LysR family transcriptional regulator n=1 Tax=Marinobacterium jannaschii TaxID=64970 RepID=UPI00048371CE|nr:LysR family transcriptional regulator [Marinobacterium jannaschii]
MINPIFLRTFMRLVETNHFTQAAIQLNMTQPGVSQHIKKLEQQLGYPLLNRHGKRFELTEAGGRLYDYGVRQIEAEVELRESIAGDQQCQGECRLACSGSMAMQLYPELLGLQQQYPGLTISLEAAPNTAIVERIKTNKTDIGLVTQPVNDAELSQTQLGQDRLCLAVPAGSGFSWQNLVSLGFINHPDGHHYAIQVLEANFADDFRGMASVAQSGYINQLSQILLPVSLGLGFTVIPRSSLAAFSQPDRIRIAEMDKPVDEPVFLVSKKHRTLPSRYQLVTELLAKQWRD